MFILIEGGELFAPEPLGARSLLIANGRIAPDRLTFSSDADSGTPDMLWRQVCELVVSHGLGLEVVLAFVTTNTAAALALRGKGRLAVG